MNISDKILKPPEFVDQNVYKTLKESANKYQDMFESAYDVFLCIDKTGLILDINRRAEILTGYSQAELRNMNVFRELVVPEDRKAIRQVVKNAVLNKSRTYEVRWQAKDGKIIQFEGTTTALTSKKGAFISTICVLRDITERKRSEEQLARITHQNQLILNSAGEGIYGLNTEGKTTFANPAAARMVGWEIDELTGKFQHDIIHHSKKDGSPFPDEECQIYAAFRDGTTQHVTDEVFWRKDGSSFPVEYTSTPIRENGKLVGSVVVFQDITERKQAEETILAVTEGTAGVTGVAFFRSLVRHLASAFRVRYAFIAECTDKEMTRVRTLAFWKGDNLGDNFTYSLKGTPCASIIDGELCYYPENIQQLFPEDQELAKLKADSYLGTPIFDTSQNILGHLVVMDDKPMNARSRDIWILKVFAVRAGAELERKRAEEALQESEERLRRIYNAAHEAIFVIDPRQNTLVETNQRAGKMLGYSEQELAGMPVKKVHPKEMDLVAEMWQKIISGDVIQTDELSCTTKSGQQIPTEICFSRVKIKDDIYILAMVRDITERKKAEQALRNALSEVEELKNRLQEENIYLQKEIKVEHNFGEIIGLSASLKKALGQVEQVASTDANVLVLGETGTGKELIARAVHELSNRKHRPLVKVNCATLPANLIESELFGHERGAFTGALSRKVGRFELADKGTIFLDEIGDLPLELQAKLLRVLQEGEFERLGSHVIISVDVRVIAATNRDIEKQVHEGTFREDLFFRLNVFPILVPPLRERKKDIPVLAKYFIEKYATKFGKQIDVVPVKVMKVLQSYHWPGNVRELENIIERAMIISVENKLELGDWFLRTVSTTPGSETQRLQELEKQHILKVLHSTMWRVSGFGGAAEILGLKPTTLESRMKKLGIKRPK